MLLPLIIPFTQPDSFEEFGKWKLEHIYTICIKSIPQEPGWTFSLKFSEKELETKAWCP